MKLKTPTKITLLLAFCLIGTTACGVRGTPEVPPPMWGEANQQQKGEALPEPSDKDENEDPNRGLQDLE